MFGFFGAHIALREIHVVLSQMKSDLRIVHPFQQAQDLDEIGPDWRHARVLMSQVVHVIY